LFGRTHPKQGTKDRPHRSQATRRSLSLAPSTVVTSDSWSVCLTSSLGLSARAATCAVCLSGSLFWTSSAKLRTNQHLSYLVLFVWQNSPVTVNQRQATQIAVLANQISRLEVRQTDRESDVTTVEGAGLAIVDWPSTFGLMPLGDHSLAPSTLVTSDSWSVCLTSSLDQSAGAATCVVCPVHSSGRVLPNNALVVAITGSVGICKKTAGLTVCLNTADHRRSSQITTDHRAYCSRLTNSAKRAVSKSPGKSSESVQCAITCPCLRICHRPSA